MINRSVDNHRYEVKAFDEHDGISIINTTSYEEARKAYNKFWGNHDYFLVKMRRDGSIIASVIRDGDKVLPALTR